MRALCRVHPLRSRLLRRSVVSIAMSEVAQPAFPVRERVVAGGYTVEGSLLAGRRQQF
jgi:hypothetical protein